MRDLPGTKALWVVQALSVWADLHDAGAEAECEALWQALDCLVPLYVNEHGQAFTTALAARLLDVAPAFAPASAGNIIAGLVKIAGEGMH